MTNEFSIKEEVRVTIMESLDMDLTNEQVNEVYEELIQDERFLNAMTIGIYRSIISVIGEDHPKSEDIESEKYRIQCIMGGKI